MIRFLHEHVWSAVSCPTGRERRIAAMAWPAALVLLGAVIAWRRARHGEPWGTAPGALWIAAAAVGGLLMSGEKLGIPTYLFFMRCFATIGLVVSTLALTVVFYVVVVPLGLLLRALGKDLLATRRAPAWVTRDSIPDRRRFYRLF